MLLLLKSEKFRKFRNVGHFSKLLEKRNKSGIKLIKNETQTVTNSTYQINDLYKKI